MLPMPRTRNQLRYNRSAKLINTMQIRSLIRSPEEDFNRYLRNVTFQHSPQFLFQVGCGHRVIFMIFRRSTWREIYRR